MRFCFFVLAALALPAVAQQKIAYTVFDGGKYQGEQLPWAASHPGFAEPALSSKDGWYSIRKAADGHFYVASFLNGFPVTFLIDTGASKSAVGMGIAKNAAIRAGVTGQAQTANGVGAVATSSGNQINVGPFAFAGMDVMVALNPASATMALLGMDVLKSFQLHQTKDTLMLRKE